MQAEKVANEAKETKTSIANDVIWESDQQKNLLANNSWARECCTVIWTLASEAICYVNRPHNNVASNATLIPMEEKEGWHKVKARERV